MFFPTVFRCPFISLPRVKLTYTRYTFFGACAVFYYSQVLHCCSVIYTVYGDVLYVHRTLEYSHGYSIYFLMVRVIKGEVECRKGA